MCLRAHGTTHHPSAGAHHIEDCNLPQHVAGVCSVGRRQEHPQVPAAVSGHPCRVDLQPEGLPSRLEQLRADARAAAERAGE